MVGEGGKGAMGDGWKTDALLYLSGRQVAGNTRDKQNASSPSPRYDWHRCAHRRGGATWWEDERSCVMSRVITDAN